MPLEEAPDTGNVIVDGFGRAHVYADHEKTLMAMDERDDFPFGVTFLSHHAVCPDRGSWSHAPGRQQTEDRTERLFDV